MAALNRRTSHVNSIREIRRLVEGAEFPNATTERLEIARASLQRHFDLFTELHIELIGGDINQEVFNAHEVLKNDIAQSVANLMATIVARIRQLNSVVQPAPVQQQPPQPQPNEQIQVLELRRLISQRIPNTWGEFDGTLTKWATFRDLFVAAIHNDGIMSGAAKLQHLMSSLKGEAREVLGHWDATNENYAPSYYSVY